MRLFQTFKITPPETFPTIEQAKINRRVALAIFLITLLAAFLVSQGNFGITDTLRRFHTTNSFWQNVLPVSQSDLLEGYVLAGVNGSVHYWYGMGQSIYMLPGDIISTLLLNLLGIGNQPIYNETVNLKSLLVVYITFPVFSAGSVAIAFLLLREFNFNLIRATCGAFSLFFGTTLLFYTQLPQENSQVLFITLAGYYLITLWIKQNRWLPLLLAGGLLGSMLLIRVTTLADIFGVAIFAFMVIVWKYWKSANFNSGKSQLIRQLWPPLSKMALAFGLGLLFFLAIDRVYQFKRFGSWTSNYFDVWVSQVRAGLVDPVVISWEPGKRFDPAAFPKDWPYNQDRLEAIFGMFFSPGKSIFLYDSLLIVLLLVIGLRHFRLERNSLNFRTAFLISAVVAMVIYVYIYSNIIFWAGDFTWGVRYLSSSVQLLCLLAVPLFLEIRWNINKLTRWFIQVLIGITFLIQLISVLIFYSFEILVYYNERNLPYNGKPITDQFVIGQRFLNVIDVITGHSTRASFLNMMWTNMTKFNVIPLNWVGLNPVIRAVLIVLWALGTFFLVTILRKFINQVRRLSAKTGEEIV